MTSQIIYEGALHTESVHLQSGTKISTDAPVDNHGKGECFSPTDMVANSLGTCMLTTMGIKAESMGIELNGTKASITKIMVADPRRIGEIKVSIIFPKLNLEEKSRTILERTAINCPVAKSLSTDVIQTVDFAWE